MDYCTGWFEGWWADCCKAHDMDYLNQVVRSVADADLASCVALSAGTPSAGIAGAVVAGIMFIGVKVFGKRFYRKAAKEAK